MAREQCLLLFGRIHIWAPLQQSPLRTCNGEHMNKTSQRPPSQVDTYSLPQTTPPTSKVPFAILSCTERFAVNIHLMK
jgi:hypothetical protein